MHFLTINFLKINLKCRIDHIRTPMKKFRDARVLFLHSKPNEEFYKMIRRVEVFEYAIHGSHLE